MDKNIVAFLRDDVRSICCQFFADDSHGTRVGKGYIYLTIDPTIVAGDCVTVLVGETPKSVLVLRVDEELNINPNDDKEYQFIVGKVDMDAYEKVRKENAQLKKVLAEGYRKNLRSSFRSAVMDSLGDDLKEKVQSILGVAPPAGV